MPRSPVLPELKFAVVGARGSGKSTFVRCALDLKKPSSSAIVSKKMSLEGVVFLISLIELQLRDVDLGENAIIWPRSVHEAGLSHVDGVLALYDVTERETLSGIPGLLNACSKTNTPCVLVSCKCDVSAQNDRYIDPREVEKSCIRETGIEGCQTLHTNPETHKRCISVVLRNLMSNHAATGQMGRPRAVTAAQLSNGNKSQAPHGNKQGHARAASEMIPASTIVAPDVLVANNLDWRQPNFTNNAVSNVPQLASTNTEAIVFDRTPDSGADMSQYMRRRSDESHLLDLDNMIDRDPIMTPAIDTPTTIANSFLEMGNDIQDEEIMPPDGGLISQGTGMLEPDSQSTGHTFDELVDRLLAQPMSKADWKFTSIFLCLYRKFAAPAELLSAVCSRFEKLTHNGEQQMMRISSQLRHLAILARWAEEYPGDFAYPVTKMQLTEFVSQVADNQLFAAAAGEMNAQLDTIVEDDDTRWLCSDHTRGFSSTLESFKLVPSMRGAVSACMGSGDTTDLVEAFNQRQAHRQKRQIGHSKASPSISNASRSESIPLSSSSRILHAVESSQRQAELLKPVPRVPLSKPQWHQFMEFSDDEIARELTRIDWVMYSAMRPRDLIRHVSLNADQREKCKGLEHVNRMINQFNHIAFWVANMILLRDKAKHRAKALEKFMGIAWRLRQMNNYNSLGAVIAGVNGTAVHRLAQTRDLVSTQARRDFMRLEILMGTQRSHFAYRLAWDNTLVQKIPFLPLHRRDLVSAEEGNRTFMPESQDRINWRKFEVMGDAIIGIQKSQETPYSPLQRNLDIQRLVLEGRFSKDDDELYERSLQVEGAGVNEPRRRFNWFQR